jgi:hypothetical protein
MAADVAGPSGDRSDPTSVDDARRLVLVWYRRARMAQIAHSRAAERARRVSLLLGVPAATLSALVGSAVLADVASGLQVLVGMLALLAAVLVSIQTFVRMDDRSREHETASRAFGRVRRQLGQLGATGGQDRGALEAGLTAAHEAYDQASEGTPTVPDRIWDVVKATGDDYWPDEFTRSDPPTQAEQGRGPGWVVGAGLRVVALQYKVESYRGERHPASRPVNCPATHTTLPTPVNSAVLRSTTRVGAAVRCLANAARNPHPRS